MTSKSSKRSVAIVGAGPSGLVAAKKLLQTGVLDVTIFEGHEGVGGLWAKDGPINPEMRANFSKFTVAFSDLSWESIPLDGMSAPVYPKAWMVEKYLQEYASRFGLLQRCEFGTWVKRASRVTNGGGKTWELLIQRQDEEEEVLEFDCLVVASGYLSTPRGLNCEMEKATRFGSSVPILHSTEVRNLNQLFPNQSDSFELETSRVLVVGGSHSGSEIATTIALLASDSRWKLGSSNLRESSNLEVFHVTSHQMHAVPAFSRDYRAKSPAFQPLDYKLHDRASRPAEQLSFSCNLTGPVESKIVKTMLKAFVEGSTEDDGIESELPPYAVVSETYPQFVKSNVIRPIVGEMIRLGSDLNRRRAVATVSIEGKTTKIDNISAVINATGYDSCGSLSFLSKEVKDELGFDASNHRLPLMLDSSYMSQRETVPDIAALGFTGVNWGVMEMQSRAIAAKWSSSSPKVSQATSMSNGIAKYIQEVRTAMRLGRKEHIPQIIFSDYMGIMEQAARELNLEKLNGNYDEFAGMVCAARYADSKDDSSEAKKTLSSLSLIEKRAHKDGLYLARSVFHGLLGSWESTGGEDDFHSLPEAVHFHPRYPTSKEYEFEYLVVESMVEESLNGKLRTMETHTIMRYDEKSDEISVWSANESTLEAEGLIYRLSFAQGESNITNSSTCSAKIIRVGNAEENAVMLNHYVFDFQGAILKSFCIVEETRPGKTCPTQYARIQNRDPLQINSKFDVSAAFNQAPPIQLSHPPFLPNHATPSSPEQPKKAALDTPQMLRVGRPSRERTLSY